MQAYIKTSLPPRVSHIQSKTLRKTSPLSRDLGFCPCGCSKNTTLQSQNDEDAISSRFPAYELACKIHWDPVSCRLTPHWRGSGSTQSDNQSKSVSNESYWGRERSRPVVTVSIPGTWPHVEVFGAFCVCVCLDAEGIKGSRATEGHSSRKGTDSNYENNTQIWLAVRPMQVDSHLRVNMYCYQEISDWEISIFSAREFPYLALTAHVCPSARAWGENTLTHAGSLLLGKV